MTTDPKTFAQRLSALMRARAMSQQALGDRLGLSQQAVQNWTRGEHLSAAENLAPIADALECSVDYLLGRSELPTPLPGGYYLVDMDAYERSISGGSVEVGLAVRIPDNSRVMSPSDLDSLVKGAPAARRSRRRKRT